MASKFKVWIHVEEVDEENDFYKDCGEPIEISICETEEKAYDLADQIFMQKNGGKKCSK